MTGLGAGAGAAVGVGGIQGEVGGDRPGAAGIQGDCGAPLGPVGATDGGAEAFGGAMNGGPAMAIGGSAGPVGLKNRGDQEFACGAVGGGGSEGVGEIKRGDHGLGCGFIGSCWLGVCGLRN